MSHQRVSCVLEFAQQIAISGVAIGHLITEASCVNKCPPPSYVYSQKQIELYSDRKLALNGTICE